LKIRQNQTKSDTESDTESDNQTKSDKIRQNQTKSDKIRHTESDNQTKSDKIRQQENQTESDSPCPEPERHGFESPRGQKTHRTPTKHNPCRVWALPRGPGMGPEPPGGQNHQTKSDTESDNQTKSNKTRPEIRHKLRQSDKIKQNQTGREVANGEGPRPGTRNTRVRIPPQAKTHRRSTKHDPLSGLSPATGPRNGPRAGAALDWEVVRLGF